ncbi:hypothetical protein LHK16_10685 [Staphylococcus argenteus]|nr:hypothetical protein [Staphylococcus argenteus]MCG9808281.1 hypothetical protein [Staphylococcus argenteus]MCG9814213.1 hypothetical protein [Staphylococcus argenteus]MCG9829785.1 hypothetical protein [Staphylococcus argenteus]MCG9840697.1 hypothetical protein [Staphylococcus argenteus]
MKITKTIGSLVLTAVLLTSVSPLTNANQIQTNNTKTAHQSYENINGVKINRNPNLPMNPEAQQRIGGTKVVKTAIKLIINNRAKQKMSYNKLVAKKLQLFLIKGIQVL